MRWLRVIPWANLAGCAASKPAESGGSGLATATADADADADADSDADADADADADSDADSDADADADTDSEPLGNACGPYAAIEDGRSWTYAYADGYSTGSYTSVVTSFDGVRGVLETDFSASGSGSTSTSSSTTTFRCDGGLISEASSSTYAGTVGGTSYSGTQETTYSSGGPTFPLEISEGGSWVVPYSGTVWDSTSGATSSFSYTVTYTAIGLETVSVPAGSWSAWRLNAVTTIGATSTSSTTWVAADVGTVQTDTTTLTGFQP